MKTIGEEHLGEYKSLWTGNVLENDLKKDIMSKELRKNHMRSRSVLRKIVNIQYYATIFKMTMESFGALFALTFMVGAAGLFFYIMTK